jgi:hypothetical protein
MALPKLETPVYTLNMPSTDEEVKYRPFLVKEQKRMMMAEESKNTKEIIDAVNQLITDCTFNKVDTKKIAMFDAEYIFLKIRSKSVGSKIDITVTCPDDKKTQREIEIDISEVEVNMTDDHTRDIQVTDNVKLVLDYPLLNDTKAFIAKKDDSVIFDALESCVKEVHFGETVYQKVDMSKKDLTEFIDSLDTEQFSKILKFFESMPKLRHVIEVTNPKTKVTSEVLLEGLDSFLE